jgi:hypothetical protein
MLSETIALELLLFALILHAALAGIDVLLNHEVLAHLPQQQNAVTEQWLHSAREFIFAALFAAVGWMQWHGVTVWVIAILLIAEFAVTLTDTVIEAETRKLPVPERIIHVLLYINFGVLCFLVANVLMAWWTKPSELIFVYHGLASWLLSLAALGALSFCIRDAVAAASLRRNKNVGYPSRQLDNLPR